MKRLEQTIFKAARKRLDLSQEELGKALGVEQPTIQRWEAGTRAPDSFEMFVKLCDALEVSADALLGRSGVPNEVELEQVISRALAKRPVTMKEDALPRFLAGKLHTALSRFAGIPPIGDIQARQPERDHPKAE